MPLVCRLESPKCNYHLGLGKLWPNGLFGQQRHFEHEQIPPPMKAPPGSWIVKIEDHGLPTGPLYITSLSKDGKPRASSEIHEARGFDHEQATEVASRMKGTVKVEQIAS